MLFVNAASIKGDLSGNYLVRSTLPTNKAASPVVLGECLSRRQSCSTPPANLSLTSSHVLDGSGGGIAGGGGGGSGGPSNNSFGHILGLLSSQTSFVKQEKVLSGGMSMD